MPESRSIFISTGDPSGDIAGYHLIENLKSLDNNLTFYGLGHQRMKSVGQNQLVDGSELAVLGFWEVARKYLFFRKLMKDSVEQIRTLRPKAVVMIDYPGFNLRLAERIKDIGIPIIYYISPQIWAWGGKRIHQIKRLVDLMLVILPFEKTVYDKAGVQAEFVGHYLFDDIKPDYIKAPYDYNSNLISLLPGSRPQEIERMLPTLIKSAELIAKHGAYRFVIAGVDGKIDYDKYLNNCQVEIEIIKGNSRELIKNSRLVLTSSGTATLETGIIGRPMIVIYKTGFITYQIARRLVKLDNIALINITSGSTIVPELIQNDANPEKISSEAIGLLDDNSRIDSILESLNKTADKLGGTGSSLRAAEAIMERF